MNDLQQTGGVNQGQGSSNLQNPVSSLQPQTQRLQGQGASTQQDVLGVSSVLTQTNPTAEVQVDTSASTGTTSSSEATPITNSGFAVSPWLIIIAGAMVIIAGISFIWSQRNDMIRL